MPFSADRYLAKQYDKRHYHCWHLICEAWEELTGDDLSVPNPRAGTILGTHAELLERVAAPVSPCIVLMLHPPLIPHVGLFRNGRVLHIRADGARNERLADAIRGFGEVRYYAKRHADQRPAGPSGRVGDEGSPGRSGVPARAVHRVAA